MTRNHHLRGCDILGADASGVALSLKNDYAAFYKDAGRTDSDPVVLRKGDTVWTAGPATGDVTPVKIPQGLPVLSSAAGYPTHAPIDYGQIYYTRTDNLFAPPVTTVTTYSVTKVPGSSAGTITVPPGDGSDKGALDKARDFFTQDVPGTGVPVWKLGLGVIGGLAAVWVGLKALNMTLEHYGHRSTPAGPKEGGQ